MTNRQLSALLALIIPDIVGIIVKKYGITEAEATDKFYASRIYELLSNPDSGVWHYSSLLVFELFDEEQKTGKITFPEEAA